MGNGQARGLYQITYAETMAELPSREIESLLAAAKTFSCGNLTVVTWGLEAEIEKDGQKIKFAPLSKFLSESSFLKF